MDFFNQLSGTVVKLDTVTKFNENHDPHNGEFTSGGGGGGAEKPAGPRPIHEIAREIQRVWSKQGKGVNYAAKPYLDALRSLSSASDSYGQDSARSVMAYFLGNASSFKGPDAKRLKDELKQHLSQKVDFASVLKGDVSGHAFHGNQYSGGSAVLHHETGDSKHPTIDAAVQAGKAKGGNFSVSWNHGNQHTTGDGKTFPDKQSAIDHANHVARTTGNIISVEKKRTPSFSKQMKKD